MKKIFNTLFVLPWHLLAWLRAAIANLLMLVVLVVIGIGFWGSKRQPTLPDKAILYVIPGQSIVEQRSLGNPLDSFSSTPEEAPAESVLHEMTSAIRWAANDRHIVGMVIQPDELAAADLGKLDSLANAITAFKASGKPVIAMGDNYNQAQYYLASLADRIYLNPMGSVQIHGFSAYQSYLKDLLDSLAVNVHVFRAGQFKSFVEPFIRNDMSPEARTNLAQWMDEQWLHFSSTLEERRKLESGSINRFVAEQDKLLEATGGNPAAMAKDFGLVDALATRTEAEKIADALGEYQSEAIDTDTYYQHIQERQAAGSLIGNTPRVAVITVSGQIMEGYQPPGQAGAETLIELIRQAREDERVRAIVLRIDSPGGSAFAAELIRSELAAAQAEGKPVVASMGGVAASGGYWVAASADEIWASPATITGSIGVFGVIPTLEGSLGKIGVHSDGHSTTGVTSELQLDRPMSPLTERVLQQGVNFTYQQFLQLVANGRQKSPEAIDLVAQGQVWTGAHAQSLGLVDHLGDVEDAVSAAAGRAKLKDYEPYYLEPALSPWQAFLQDFASSALLPGQWGSLLRSVMALPVVEALSRLQAFNDPNHIYVHCWECKRIVR